jgi:hypothetical protein
VAAFAAHERAVLNALRLHGRRERGGLDCERLASLTGLTRLETALILATLLAHNLICSALVDGRESMLIRQRRLWYLTKGALAPQ